MERSNKKRERGAPLSLCSWFVVTAFMRSGRGDRMNAVTTCGLRALLVGRSLVLKQRGLAADDRLRDDVLDLGLDVGQLEHDVGHDLFDDAAEAAGTRVALPGLLGNHPQR